MYVGSQTSRGRDIEFGAEALLDGRLIDGESEVRTNASCHRAFNGED